MRGWAFGVLRLSLVDFYEMRVGVFWEAWGAYNKEKFADRKHVGELIRGATIRLFNIQLPRKNQIKSPSDFWQMPWDDDEKSNDEIVKALNSLSDEDRAMKARELLDRIGWNKNG